MTRDLTFRHGVLPHVVVLGIGIVMAAPWSTRALAQTWERIDCQRSPFRLEGTVCYRIERVQGTASVGQFSGDDFHIAGRAGAFTFKATYFSPPAQAPNTIPGWRFYSLQVSERIIRGYAGSDAREFTSYRGFGHTGYLQYRKSALHCVGFDHGTLLTGDTYEYFVRGEICSAQPLAAPEQLARDLLAGVNVYRSGFTTPVNAFNATPAPLPWDPASVAPAAGSIEQRLLDLQAQRDRGEITPSEYMTRRRALVDGE